MDEDVYDPGIARPNSTLHVMGDVVAFADWDVASDADVKINVKIQTHFADETFVDPDHAGH